MATTSSKQGRGGGSGIRLLAFDGGGVRGLSSLGILQRIMEYMDRDNPPRPCECFDVICGTSTGGLIAIMLGRLQMSVAECIAEYKTLSAAVFTKARHRVGWSGKLQGRYDHEALEQGVKDLLRRRGLSEDELMKEGDGTPRCKTFVCAMSQQTSRITLFPSYYSKTWGAAMLDRVRIWEAARATSAATSFFEPLSIDGKVFADGATGANNPVYELWAEALAVFCQGDETQMLQRLECLLSIGTGVPSLKSFGPGIKETAKALKSLTIEPEEKSRQFERDFPSLVQRGIFYRFNVDQGLNKIGLEAANRIGDIDACTDLYCRSLQIRERMEACTRAIKQKKPSQTANQPTPGAVLPELALEDDLDSSGSLLEGVKKLEANGAKAKKAVLRWAQSESPVVLDLDTYLHTQAFQDWLPGPKGALMCTVRPPTNGSTPRLADMLTEHVDCAETHTLIYVDCSLPVLTSHRQPLSRLETLKTGQEAKASIEAADISPIFVFLFSQIVANLSRSEIHRVLKDYVARLSTADMAEFCDELISSGRPPLNHLPALLAQLIQLPNKPLLISIDRICELEEPARKNLVDRLSTMASSVKVLLCGSLSECETLGGSSLAIVTPKTEMRECLESLSFPEINVRKSQVSPAAVGTSSWIWSHGLYRMFSTQSSGILWIRGKPGSGKSVLARAIQEKLLSEFANKGDCQTKPTWGNIPLLESMPPLVGDWFYHGRRGGAFVKHDSLVRSLLFHFLQQRPAIFEEFLRDSYRDIEPRAASMWARSVLKQIFYKICRSNQPVFCVIDAVDEAESTAVVQLLKVAIDSDSVTNTKFILLSRPNAEIERQVLDYPCIVVEDENAKDIAKIVELGINSLQRAIHSLHFEHPGTSNQSNRPRQMMRRFNMQQPRHQHIKTMEAREKSAIESIRTRLLSKAQGSILWVKLVLDKLNQEAEGNHCSTLEDLQDATNEIPEELTAYYKQIAKELTSGKMSKRAHEVRRILMWICAAGEVSDVTLDSLWEAIALLKDDNASETLEGIWDKQISVNSYDELWRKIYSTCGPFIEIFNPGLSAEESRVYHYGASSVVQLMHQSVRDFLCDPVAADCLHFGLDEANKMVTDQLVQYLTVFARDSKRLQLEGEQEAGFLVSWFDQQRLLQMALSESRRGRWPILEEIKLLGDWKLKEPVDQCEAILQDVVVAAFQLTDSVSPRTILGVGRMFYRACTDGLATAVRNMLSFGWPRSSVSAHVALAGVMFAATRCRGDGHVKIPPLKSTGQEEGERPVDSEKSTNYALWHDCTWVVEVSTSKGGRHATRSFTVPCWYSLLDYVGGSKARALEESRIEAIVENAASFGVWLSPEDAKGEMPPMEDVEEAITVALVSNHFDYLQESIDLL